MLAPRLLPHLVFFLPLVLSSFCIGEASVLTESTLAQHSLWHQRRAAAETDVPTSAPVIVEYWPTDPILSNLPSRSPTSSFGFDPDFIVEASAKPTDGAAPTPSISSGTYTAMSSEKVLENTVTVDATSGTPCSAGANAIISALPCCLWMVFHY